MKAALPAISGRSEQSARQLPFVSGADVDNVRRVEVSRSRAERLVEPRRGVEALRDVREERRLIDDELLLSDAVVEDRVEDDLRFQPVVKDSRPASKYGVAIFVRRPGECEARRDVRP